jgi:hypothetical protein
MRKLIALTLIVASFSCEKVIDIPVDDAEQRIVVEGQLYDMMDESFVRLSRTGSVYQEDNFEFISGASVTVTDNQGGSWVFVESSTESGLYTDPSFVAQPLTTYNLLVDINGEIITAQTQTYNNVAFDSLDYFLQVGGGFGGTGNPDDTSFFTFYNFTDDPAYTNYYRAIPFKNGVPGAAYLSEDELFNGQNYRQPFFADVFEPKDTLWALLTSMDADVYKYFSSLENNQDSGPFSAVPSNPVSNLTGNAIGFFGAFLTDTAVIIYP